MVSPRLAADYVTVNNLKQLKLINTRAASLSLDDLVYTAALEHEDLIKLGMRALVAVPIQPANAFD